MRISFFFFTKMWLVSVPCDSLFEDWNVCGTNFTLEEYREFQGLWILDLRIKFGLFYII